MMSLAVLLPIKQMRYLCILRQIVNELVLHSSLSMWQLFTGSVCATKSNIFFLRTPAGCLYNAQRPAYSEVYFHTTNLLLSRAGCVQAALNTLTHRICLRRLTGDYSVDQGQDCARTLKMQQYLLHFDGQELLKLLI